MNLENKLFKHDFHYRIKFANKCLAIIKYSKNEKRVVAFKNLMFRMMKDIVRKNIHNYLNLLSSIGLKDEYERDELVSECYVIFDKCVKKYIINDKNNFYFYFNKSLSRNFYRKYQKEFQKKAEVTEITIENNRSFHSELDITELLLDNLDFSPLEKKVCESRLLGQKVSEFLNNNPDISNMQYSKALRKIKEKLITLREKGEI